MNSAIAIEARGLARVGRSLSRWIDWKTAWMGALGFAAAVFYMNLEHGGGPAAVAAAKQASYTFLAAGLMARLTENLATAHSSRWASFALAMGVSSALAIGLTLLLHSARGTPEPLLSTVPTMLAAPPGFAFIAWRRQRTMAGSG